MWRCAAGRTWTQSARHAERTHPCPPRWVRMLVNWCFKISAICLVSGESHESLEITVDLPSSAVRLGVLVNPGFCGTGLEGEPVMGRMRGCEWGLWAGCEGGEILGGSPVGGDCVEQLFVEGDETMLRAGGRGGWCRGGSCPGPVRWRAGRSGPGSGWGGSRGIRLMRSRDRGEPGRRPRALNW